MEEWRRVEGWEDFYEVSDQGRVRSIDRRHPVINRFGNIEHRLHRGKLLKASPAKNGYPVVSLTRPGAVRSYRYVHHLVANAFLVRPGDGVEICHNNGQKTDCRKSNLRFDSRSANALDRHKHGTMNPLFGEEHFFSKLDLHKIEIIRKRRSDGDSVRQIARDLGVSHKTVSSVLQGKSWVKAQSFL